VYVNEQGERMSRLKEVNSDWILHRLERWGQKVSHLVLQQHCLKHHSFPLPALPTSLPFFIV
jgi:hypothetical protein